MASPLRLTACWGETGRGRSAHWVEDAWLAVRAEFEAAEAEMSRFRESSDVTRLNRTAGSGQGVRVPRRLERALVAADRAHRITDGRFDPRVLRDLDRLGYAGVPVAKGARTDGPARPIVERTGRGMVAVGEPIDLGGIGKGLALRWAAATLERHGIVRYLLEAGGDLVAYGLGPEDDAWVVGIEDPSGREEPLAAIAMEDGAAATSSTRRLSWIHDGRPVHHLLDPRTGEPAQAGLRAVTVVGPDPAWAEVWSKTLFIGGRAGIAREARSRGLAAWWVTDDGSLEMTAAARARTLWVAGEA